MSVDPAVATLATCIIGLTVTAVGWIAVHHLSRRREIEARAASEARADRTRRLELQLRYYERQIEEFYGPIYSLIQTIFAVWHVKHRLESGVSPRDNEKPLGEVKAKFDEFVVTVYFNPIHQEIRKILNAKLFLIKGANMSDSFYAYLKHSVMENMQHRLWTEYGISTMSVKGEEWSDQFRSDIKRGLDHAVEKYDDLVDELERSAEPQALSHGPEFFRVPAWASAVGARLRAWQK
jgi:hypothetical protein